MKMKAMRVPISFIMLIFMLSGNTNTYGQVSFKTAQLRYERVRKAYELKESTVINRLKQKGISDFNIEICLIAYKSEKQLELWVRKKQSDTFSLFHTYGFCSSSGELGPKRMQGDRQIPEGIYFINRFNPASQFHLSLGLNYPNESDKILGNKTSLGGDIFIHGDCVTIGCIPITDDKIREVYLLAVEAKDKGQNTIPVLIFPFRLTETNLSRLKETNQYSSILFTFWGNLQTIYLYFEQYKNLPSIGIDRNGRYTVN